MNLPYGIYSFYKGKVKQNMEIRIQEQLRKYVTCKQNNLWKEINVVTKPSVGAKQREDSRTLKNPIRVEIHWCLLGYYQEIGLLVLFNT
jgi:hypothetical protein